MEPARLLGEGFATDRVEIGVPGEVDCEGDDTAYADCEEGEAAFAGGKAVDAGVDYGEGLEEHWDNC